MSCKEELGAYQVYWVEQTGISLVTLRKGTFRAVVGILMTFLVFSRAAFWLQHSH